MKKPTAITIFLSIFSLQVMLLLPLVSGRSVASAISGNGSEDHPFVITNCQELQGMADDLDAHYALGNDIDCSSTVNWNGGKGFKPVGDFVDDPPFTGSLDGKNHSVFDLAQNGWTRSSEGGLFGYTENATVKNLNLVRPVVRANWYVGTIAGQSNNTHIEKVSAQDVTISCIDSNNCGYIGGLMGYVMGGTIKQSWTSGVMHVNESAGGIVEGLNSGATMSDCYSTVTISGKGAMGGLVYSINDAGSRIDNSYSDVTFNAEGPSRIGGLAVRQGNDTHISNSFSTSMFNANGQDTSEFAALVVSAGTMTNNYYDAYAAGDIGQACADSSECAAVNTSNSNPSYFLGNRANAPLNQWNFDTIWTTRSNKLPVLRVFLASPPPPAPDSAPNDSASADSTVTKPISAITYSGLNYFGSAPSTPLADIPKDEGEEGSVLIEKVAEPPTVEDDASQKSGWAWPKLLLAVLLLTMLYLFWRRKSRVAHAS